MSGLASRAMARRSSNPATCKCANNFHLIDDLASRIAADAGARLESFDRILSDEDWASLCALASTISAMAHGKAEPLIYLASNPTGWGKTEIISAAVRVIVNDPSYSHVGFLILVQTLEQIPALISRMELREDQYVVRTGKDNVDLNGRGLTGNCTTKKCFETIHRQAPVLFTTQAKLKAMMVHQKSFANMPFFEYRGILRQVRLWDESFLPIDPVIISLDDINQFADILVSHGQPDAARTLRHWVRSIRKTLPSFDKIPLWAAELTLTGEERFKDELCQLQGESEKQQIIADAMFWLQGREVKIVRQSYNKKTISISFRQSVPYDIEPIMIFDAGASDAAHYRLMAKSKGNVVQLPSVKKTYHNLKIRVWDHPSGQAAYRSPANIDELAAAVAQAVCEKPKGEEVLIVRRKGDKAPASTLPALIGAKVRALGGDSQCLRFVHWGAHKWTNAFRNIKHIIVVGVHQAPLSAIVALVYGTTKTPMSDHVKPSDIELMRMSQMTSDLNQAVGRGAVRNFKGGDVPEGCTLDLIASSWGPMGFKDPHTTLSRMFPGATIKQWLPSGLATNGKLSNDPALIEAAISLLGRASSVDVTAQVWGEMAGISARTVRRKLNDPNFVSALGERGIWVESVSGRGLRLRKVGRPTLIKKT